MITAEQSVLMIVDVQGKLAQVMQQSEQLHQKLAVLIQGRNFLIFLLFG
ncbi:hypothetical protein PEC18_05265 [Paucibacter sp. O1-1]|nr:hypothetical protein [Paucibacter sp. O1-1]MDA3825278.1 hypothetical protein [Paucibacter sp. O1-1]